MLDLKGMTCRQPWDLTNNLNANGNCTLESGLEYNPQCIHIASLDRLQLVK